VDIAGRPARQSAALAFAWGGGALFVLSLLYFLYSYLFRFGAPAGGSTTLVRSVVIDILLFTGFAAHHSVLARPWMKTLVRRVVPAILERSTYTWTSSVLLILVCAFWQFVPGELYRLSGPAVWIGLLVQGLGIVLTARGSARLDVLDLAGVRPVLRGARGGIGRERVQLETGGLYGFVRHPVYFAWLLFVFGTPHMTFTRLVFAVVSTVYLAIAIPFEERSLIQTFGQDYRTYQRRVRWRMVPGVY
jgi:protein-S-isoprenylcysteine O-methyltransferase Ste14